MTISISRSLMEVFRTASRGRKVAVLGAAGGIGQPLSLLLKCTPSSISSLSLYDICNMGMSVDLSHIPTPIKVSGYSNGQEELEAALENAEVVVIPAGVPRKPGMSRDDLFNINAGIVRDLSKACAKVCPNAHVLVICNPVNSTVPIAYETMRNAGVSSPSVLGITTLDVIRAKTFIGELKKVDPATIEIDVIGGHSGQTILPLLSTVPGHTFTEEETKMLVSRIQYGGDEVVKAKDGGGSATLSMAYAGNEFVQKFMNALDGKQGIVVNTFMRSDEWDKMGVSYFAGRVELAAKGVSKILPLPKMNQAESDMYDVAIKELKINIAKGVEFALQASL